MRVLPDLKEGGGTRKRDIAPHLKAVVASSGDIPSNTRGIRPKFSEFGFSVST